VKPIGLNLLDRREVCNIARPNADHLLMPRKARKAYFPLAVILSLAMAAAFGQAPAETPEVKRPVREAPGEFQFVRLAYSANSYGRGGWGRRDQMWRTDWPDAEHHFSRGVDRLTRIEVAESGRILTPLDDEIYDYPWIYAVEVGYWYLNDQEAGRIRDYLLRGGFLMVDDFHGTWEWAAFVESMERVFPDRPIVDIPEGDEAFHVHYDLDQKIQIPSRMFTYSGVTWEKDGYTPHWRGIYDDDGRLMVATRKT
jgi:hypothetical protein